jgi:hypothetical protein
MKQEDSQRIAEKIIKPEDKIRVGAYYRTLRDERIESTYFKSSQEFRIITLLVSSPQMASK